MKIIKLTLCALVALIMLLVMLHPLAAVGDQRTDRTAAMKLQTDGNWKEAYTLYSRLATDPGSDSTAVVDDFNAALIDLQRLDRESETDTLREKAIAAQPHNWRLLITAAHSLVGGTQYGYMVAGKFERGNHRGGGKYMSSSERDRVRALQLMAQAIPLLAAEPKKTDVGDFYLTLAGMVTSNRETWRLQELTDLASLPDYDEGYGYRYRGASQQGAPVAADGTPIYFSLPAAWAGAKNDGERWRWALAQMAACDPARADSAKMALAGFLYSQFGEGTLADYASYFNAQEDETAQAGSYAVETLTDNETLARLANGVHRFPQPPEQNFITLYTQVANGASPEKMNAERNLAMIFENRRQFDRAADYWKKAGDNARVQQILGNWGTFAQVATQPANPEVAAKIDFTFRNATKVILTAERIDVSTLLSDVKAYIETNPKQLDWQSTNIQNLGERMVEGNLAKYLVGQPVSWSQALTPRPKHFDRRVTLDVPVHDAGAYLLTAKMKDGNTNRVILWLADTVIVKKPLDKQTYLYLADAVSGEGLASADLSFFGYKQTWINDGNGKQHYDITTKTFAKQTDNDGQLLLDNQQDFNQYSWIITSRKDKRLAFLGYTQIWSGQRYDETYNQVKTFAITDRPAYRPGQVVKYKFWVNRAQYDKEGPSEFANQNLTIIVRNPKGETVHTATLAADTYGGVNGEFSLPTDATLGQYSAAIDQYGGGIGFRVEEYKKPEFEVSIAAPEKPVMLGESVSAKITARYYFGAPVTNAKVSYKITRSPQDAVWYPAAEWDWCFGSGYWWFAPDYAWYPGWGQ